MFKLSIFLISIMATAVAQAGESIDALNKCMAVSATAQEKTALARWFIVSAGKHPAMSDIVSISRERKEEIDKAVGDMDNRILTEACAKELKRVVQMEGVAGAKTSFKFFGQLAMAEVLTNPEVLAAYSGAERYIDIEKINAIINSK